MIRIAFASLLVLHGIAHGVGLAASWQLGEFRDAPLDTTLLGGRLDVGVAGTRAIGVLWLLTGLGFAAAAVGVWRGAEWWIPVTAGVAAASLLLSVLGWPEARIGIPLNLAILAGLFFVIRSGGSATSGLLP